jgi:hypothetical protein
MFGPVENGDGSWRIRMNYELSELVKQRRHSKIYKNTEEWLG